MATATVITDYETRDCATESNTGLKLNRSDDPISKRDVELIVNRAFGPKIQLVDYHVKVYSTEKIVFMGTHQHLVVTVKRDNREIVIRTFFFKGIPREIEEQASVIFDSRAFYKEANFYELILPELLISIDDKNWAAQCYLAKKHLMVFEDLKSLNFTMKDKFLDVTSIKSALTALAKMHAATILAEKRTGKTFLKLFPDVFVEMLFVKKGKKLHEWFQTGVKTAVSVAKLMGLDHDRVPKVCDLIFDALRPSEKWRNVICHGDSWSNNLMFDDSQPLPNCYLVDFQTIRYVPPTADVAQLFYLTMTKAFREINEEELLRYYHEIFCITLRENDEEISLPSFEETVQEYEDMRVFGVVSSVIYYPVMLLDNNLCAELTKDSDGYIKLLFHDHSDLIIDTIKNDAFYNDRIMETVAELVQRSKKLLK